MLFDATVEGRSRRVEVRAAHGRYTVTIDDRVLEIDFAFLDGTCASLLVGGASYDVAFEPQPSGVRVHLRDAVVAVELARATRGARAEPRRLTGPARVTAPMPGRIVRVLAEPGTDVVTGQGLVVVEAMKMENEIKAPRAGRIHEIAVREGQAVEAGSLLVLLV
jgi:biotin carboxyl carrier protein